MDSKRYEIINYFYDHFSEPITIKEIANEFHISRKHLHHIVKEREGMSPKEFLTELRLSFACELLRKTDLPIGVIAEQCGYKSTKNFTRAFHKRFDYPPTTWRRRHLILNLDYIQKFL